jgi:hypothetical protein
MSISTPRVTPATRTVTQWRFMRCNAADGYLVAPRPHRDATAFQDRSGRLLAAVTTRPANRELARLVGRLRVPRLWFWGLPYRINQIPHPRPAVEDVLIG